MKPRVLIASLLVLASYAGILVALGIALAEFVLED